MDPALLAQIKEAIRSGAFQLRVSYSSVHIDLHDYGVPCLSELWRDDLLVNGQPDKNEIQRLLAYLPVNDRPDDLQIDGEWLLWAGQDVTPEQRAINIQKYKDVIAILRELRPDAQVSIFGQPFCPRNIAAWSDAALATWQTSLGDFDELAGLVDVIAPEFYTRFSDYRTWITYATRSIQSMQARWSTPIEPVLYGQLYDTFDTPDGTYVCNTNTWIDSNYLLQQIATCYQQGCAGATVFCEHTWDPAAIPWLNTLIGLFQ